MGKIYKNSILYGGGGSGGAGGHTIQDTDGTDMPAEDNLQFVGLDVQDDSTNDATTVEAFGLNSDSLDDVVDGSIGNEIINNGMCYSTNEQIVGKWIDGKPIYQKTWATTRAGDTPEITIAHGLSYERVIDMEGMICGDNAAKTTVPLNFNWVSADGTQSQPNSDVFLNTSSMFIRIRNGEIPFASTIYITLRYTKTTS